MRVEQAVSDGFHGRFEGREIGSLDMHRERGQRAVKRTAYGREHFAFYLEAKNKNEGKKCSRHGAPPRRPNARPR